MAIAREFNATPNGGHLPAPIRLGIAETLKQMDGKRLTISIKEATRKRTLPQNRYWFGALGKHVVPVFREYGDTWSEFKVHEYIMKELGYEEVLQDPKGKLFVSRKHSSEFSTIEWEEFMERGREFLMRVHGIEVPQPNEVIP